jgi:hypothetical protein
MRQYGLKNGQKWAFLAYFEQNHPYNEQKTGQLGRVIFESTAVKVWFGRKLENDQGDF